MKKAGVVLVLGLGIILTGWWFISGGSLAQPTEGIVDVWATWGDDGEHLQALLDQFSQSSDISVRVTTRIGSDDLLEALESTEPPDLVILSSHDLIEAYHDQGLVELLDDWIEDTGIDLDDIYPAPLEQCKGMEGRYLCLPWGCDVDALFWNKDLFQAAGLDPERPPQTMEEMIESAEKLTVRDEQGELEQAGFIPDLARPHTELYIGMFGGALYGDSGSGLTANSRAAIDALDWERQLYDIYTSEELQELVSSFTPYQTSRHALYAGRRLSCHQCHRASPIQNGKTPETGFLEGRLAMMIDGQWLASLDALSRQDARVNYGVAPFPPPAAHRERAKTAVVQGPVVFIPAGARDKGMAANLLAWMVSPEIVADASLALSSLPTSRTAAQHPRFAQAPSLEVFMDLLAHPDTGGATASPISPELNEALRRVEEEVLHGGGDPVLLLNEVQAELASKLEEALGHDARP